MDTIRRHLVFHGYVQGVGFRYQACHTARRLGITGWVRNLDDGSVEMEAEGTEADISALIDRLENHSWAQVDRVESKRIPAEGGYGFDIL